MTTRGELRIHLGAAPGVGKTFAMLSEAHRRAGRGTDVVVGLVETHGRGRTAALLEGLQVLPRRTECHRGVVLSELDVDAVLARAPEVVLVDELAHTNAPGSRHPKRWQDVEELLAAGISVLTTVNVQHLESLNDVVERITGVRQRETVPDEVVRRADQVELVDITPEALRRRLAHGNVYAADRIDAALAHYFHPRNLTALRELALLWLADQVEVALRRYRTDAQVEDVWETRERVVVAITGGAESDTVLRRAARIAERSGSADLLAVHVLRGDGLAGVPVGAIARLRRLADDLGASFHTVVGDATPAGVAAALLDFARGAGATQLVLGTSRRSRLARVLVESISTRVVQESGQIDVHMVTHAEAGRGLALPHGARSPAALSVSRRAAGWAAGLALPVLATTLGVTARSAFGISTDVVLFFLGTIGTALLGGLGPALLAALLGGLLLNFFLTPPLYTLAIANRENVITVVAMVLVAVLVALVVDRAARRAQQADTARAEAALLASFSRAVLARTDPLDRLLEKVREAFGLRCVAVLQHRDGAWAAVAGDGPTDPGLGDPGEADVDVAVDTDVHLVGYGRALPAAERRLLEAVAGPALLALRNRQVAAQAAQANRRADATRLRTALLSAVGHDLRSPLASIKAAAQSLGDPDLHLPDDHRAELTTTIEESADRLTALVANLLDSSRLATGAVTPELRPVGYDDVVAQALRGIDLRGLDRGGLDRGGIDRGGIDRGGLDRGGIDRGGIDGGPRVTVEVDERLPEVLADAGLLERVVANLVDNALRHGAGAPVAVRASAHGDRVELRVVDSGPGVSRGGAERLFVAFQHLGDRDHDGLGLGLSVGRGFTEAMGGTLAAEDTPGGGLTFVVSLPAAGSDVAVDEPAEALQ